MAASGPKTCNLPAMTSPSRLTRDLGEITYPKPNRPNVSTDFLTTQQLIYASDSAFRSDLRGAMAANGRDAVIFVHGFNNTFTEGLYRIAQLRQRSASPRRGGALFMALCRGTAWLCL